MQLVTGELFPSSRVLKEEGDVVPGEVEMVSVEHLGQYVYDMTNTKVQQLRAERGLPEGELVVPPMGDAKEVGYIGEEDEMEMEEGFEAEEAEEPE